jgi:Ca2+-binding RTX toxin-like protein
MAGTFKFTFGGDFDSSSAVDLFKSNTLLSSFAGADNYCYIGNSTSVSSGMVYSVDKSTNYLLFASQSLSLKDAGGLYLDFSDGNASAEFHGNMYGDVLVGGGQNDLLYGGGGNDQLTGNGGNDTLQGDSGTDTMTGGAGDDTYYVDNLGDVITEAADGGNDTAIYLDGAHPQLAENVENLTLVGWNSLGRGNDLDNIITGSDTVNSLYGEKGNDTIDGGASYDSMYGGQGDDSYVVDNAYDVVKEEDEEGDDTVQSSIDYTLTANVENLRLTGSAVSGTGNDENNDISGNELANTLDGGAGADVLAGGLGDDIYVVDNAGDTVTEADDEGSDTVNASIDYTLTAFVENLILTGAAVSGTGNDLANTITGNDLANTLDGGAGADTLIGGGGKDTYIVDSVDDVVTETDGGGTDTVQASVSLTLGAFVENLLLTGSAVSGTGNDESNVITGNELANKLDGGAGADRLIGGAGDDLYLVDNAKDVVKESDEGGTDTVRASVSFKIGAFIEDLRLTGSAVSGTGNDLGNAITGNGADNTLRGGLGADTIVGGDGEDTIKGDDGKDTISGGTGDDKLYGGTGNDTIDGGSGNDFYYGGAGRDTLVGSKGADIFVFAPGDMAATKAGADLIESFSGGQGDRIDLSKIDADEGSNGRQHFTGITTAAFDGQAGELRYINGSDDTFILGDTDGDKVADFYIHLDKAIALKDGFFLF